MKTILLAIISGAGIAAVIFIIFSFTSLYPLVQAPTHDWKTYREIDTPGLNDKYQVNQTIQFTVLNKGYGNIPCMTPDVVIYNNDNSDNPVFHVKGVAIECPPQTQFENYTLYFPSKTNSYVTSVNKAGNYTLGISFGDTSILKQFSIIPTQNQPIDYDVPDDFRVSSSAKGLVLLDTQKNLYHPDICSPSINFRLDLSPQERQQIWQSVKVNKFFELSDFIPKCGAFENCVHVMPEIVVTLNITANGKTHSVTHHSSYIQIKNDNFDSFENVLETINKILSQKNELNNFTGPRCGLL